MVAHPRLSRSDRREVRDLNKLHAERTGNKLHAETKRLREEVGVLRRQNARIQATLAASRLTSQDLTVKSPLFHKRSQSTAHPSHVGASAEHERGEKRSRARSRARRRWQRRERVSQLLIAPPMPAKDSLIRGIASANSVSMSTLTKAAAANATQRASSRQQETVTRQQNNSRKRIPPLRASRAGHRSPRRCQRPSAPGIRGP